MRVRLRSRRPDEPLSAMSPHTIFRHRRNGSRDGSASSIPFRLQPSSPTLTNPDMILPDYNDASHLESLPQSPPAIWKVTPSALPDLQSPSSLDSQPTPVLPTTPIIYGNGTMLSDIGEVTEAESAVDGALPKQPPSRLSGSDGSPLRSSPTIGKKEEVPKKRAVREPQRPRRLSIESSSTINDTDRVTSFGDFDDCVSVDDSNFQGDDEESMASSFAQDVYSTTSLSKRAEQILANAKRRLTTMEGNLNRARTLSYSSASVSDGSSPSPMSPASRSLKSLRENGLSPPGSSHARNMSDTDVQPVSRAAGQFQRSASAMGAAGGYREPLTLSKLADPCSTRQQQEQQQPLSARISQHPLGTMLSPLREDPDAPAPVSAGRGQEGDSPLAGHVGRTSSPYPVGEPARSPSSLQVRSLQDQMQGLKGKISSLKQQAQADSHKRRSLQRMRAPSPFTHATWDLVYADHRRVASPHSGSPSQSSLANKGGGGPAEPAVNRSGSERASPRPSQPQPHHALRDDDQEELPATIVPADAWSLQSRSPNDLSGKAPAPAEMMEDKEEMEEEAEEEADVEAEINADATEVGSISESGESSYHDSNQHPLSHEDREDAFDYEHFFLHSAMGNRGSESDSGSSEDSVETTRGPAAVRERRYSLETVATEDSFATAVEDRVELAPSKKHEFSANGLATRPAQEVGLAASDDPGADPRNGALDLRRDGHETPELGGSRLGRQPSPKRTARTRMMAALHRPSTSSFESTGTNRSFPLVNKTRLKEGMLTPSGSLNGDGGGEAGESLAPSESISSSSGRESAQNGLQSPAIQTLSSEDQALVERVVASLGKCVLGLTGDGSRPLSAGQELCRRRIEAARKALEGSDDTPKASMIL